MEAFTVLSFRPVSLCAQIPGILQAREGRPDSSLGVPQHGHNLLEGAMLMELEYHTLASGSFFACLQVSAQGLVLMLLLLS